MGRIVQKGKEREIGQGEERYSSTKSLIVYLRSLVSTVVFSGRTDGFDNYASEKERKNTKKDRSSYTNRHELYSTLDRYILARLNRSSLTPLTGTTDLLDLPYSHALVIRFFLCISANSHAIYRFCITGTDRA